MQGSNKVRQLELYMLAYRTLWELDVVSKEVVSPEESHSLGSTREARSSDGSWRRQQRCSNGLAS